MAPVCAGSVANRSVTDVSPFARACAMRSLEDLSIFWPPPLFASTPDGVSAATRTRTTANAR